MAGLVLATSFLTSGKAWDGRNKSGRDDRQSRPCRLVKPLLWILHALPISHGDVLSV